MDNTAELETTRRFFWQAITSDIGVVSGHIRNLLDFTGLSATAALANFVESSNVARLQELLRAQTNRIKQHCLANSLPLRSFFPDDGEFSFSFVDEMIIHTIAQKVTENGIKKYLPALEIGQKRSELLSSLQLPIDEVKESKILLEKLQSFYRASPPDDILHQYFDSINTLDVTFERVPGAKIAAYVRCGLCSKQGPSQKNKEKRIKALKHPDVVWPIHNLLNHFNKHSPLHHSHQTPVMNKRNSGAAAMNSISTTEYIEERENDAYETLEFLHDNALLSETSFEEGTINDNADRCDLDSFEKTADNSACSNESSNSGDSANIFTDDYDGLFSLEKAPVLSVMMRMHLRNINKHPNGRRYSNLEKDICAFEYLTAGNDHYSYLTGNANIVGKRTLQDHLKKDTVDIKEGIIDVTGLKQYLTNNGFPLAVALCEDGTRITPTIQYDYTNDSIRGLVAPLDQNGLPESHVFCATSPYKMANDVKYSKVGNYAYVQMAIPLSKDAAPFVLFHFCTNNRFTAFDVERRLMYTQQLLKSVGISVVSIASDGDSRLLKYMKKQEGLGGTHSHSYWGEWFIANDRIDSPICVQDMTHTVNKLRNRFAHIQKRSRKPTRKQPRKQPDLMIGKYLITTEHLKELVRCHNKDKHQLNLSDIEIKDKMKVKPTLKMINPSMIEYLEQNVQDSSGTVLYLNLMRKLYHAFLDPTLTPLERVLEIWVATLIVRAWRNWCGDEHGNLNRFITTNAYVCIEINAHALIKFIQLCRNNNVPHQFLIAALSSQPCEKLFAQLRTMATTNQTVVNFSIKELTDKLKRVQMKLNIMYRNSNKIKFPCIERLKNRAFLESLPMEDEIFATVQKAFIIAGAELAKVGISTPNFTASIDFRKRNQILFIDIATLSDDSSDSDEDDSEESEEEIEHDIEFVEVAQDHITDDGESVDTIYELSRILPNDNGDVKITQCRTGERHTFELIDFKGKVISLKKEYLLYLITPGRYQLPADRTQRFSHPEYIGNCVQHNIL